MITKKLKEKYLLQKLVPMDVVNDFFLMTLASSHPRKSLLNRTYIIIVLSGYWNLPPCILSIICSCIRRQSSTLTDTKLYFTTIICVSVRIITRSFSWSQWSILKEKEETYGYEPLLHFMINSSFCFGEYVKIVYTMGNKYSCSGPPAFKNGSCRLIFS